MPLFIQYETHDVLLYAKHSARSTFTWYKTGKSGTSPGYPSISDIMPKMALLYATQDPYWSSDLGLKACDVLFYIQSKAEDGLICPRYPLMSGIRSMMSYVIL